MGNFANDTAVTAVGEDGRFTATLEDRWRIWGPNGGYVAAAALRAAGRMSRFARPTSVSVQFFGVAAFAPVDIVVEVLKTTRRTDALRATMTQDGKPILSCTVWAVTDDLPDRRHNHGDQRPYDAWDKTPTIPERLAEAGMDPADERPPFVFWENFEQRPIEWIADWENRGVLDPEWASWMRFVDGDPGEDAWLEAAKLLLLVDLGGWPAAHRAYPPGEGEDWYAPSLDVHCQFVDLDTSAWLCTEAVSPVARDGLLNANARVWADDGRLLASGITQLIATPMRPIAERNA